MDRLHGLLYARGGHRIAGTALLTIKDLAGPRVNLKLFGADAGMFNWSHIPLHDDSFNARDGLMESWF